MGFFKLVKKVTHSNAVSGFGKMLYRKLTSAINKRGNDKKCNICENTFKRFNKYRGGFKNVPQWRKELDIAGSDIDNFTCPYCGNHDRTRHLFMYFDKTAFWQKFENSSILHIAPEKSLSTRILSFKPDKYIPGDLYPENQFIERIDLTAIPYNDNSFDLFIGNHVLEHIPDYILALTEVYRILKPGGIAILQTPYSRKLVNNFEANGITTDEQRKTLFGQEDHVRIFSETGFFNALKNAGFSLKVTYHSELFSADETFYYGVNKKEDFITCIKAYHES